MTMHISIGNSDDKLTQTEWSDFTEDLLRIMSAYAREVYGVWYSSPSSRYQNMCIAFQPHTHARANVYGELSRIAKKYRQDSIAVLEGKTEFIS